MSVSYDITGKIKVINPAQSFGAKGFTKREFVVTVEDGKFSQDIALEVHADKCDTLDAFAVGQEVIASFNLRGREYNGRYFNNLLAWKIVRAGNQSVPPVKAQPATATAATDSFDDAIPF